MHLKVMWYIFLLTSLLLGTASALQAQSYTIRFNGLDKEPALHNKYGRIVIEKQAIDSTQADLQSAAWAMGYFQSYCYAETTGKDTVNYQCHLGPQYQFIDLDVSGLPVGVREDAQKFNIGNGKIITASEWGMYCKKILKYYDENGYPFAKMYLTDLDEKLEGLVAAKLMVDVGDLRTIDSI